MSLHRTVGMIAILRRILIEVWGETFADGKGTGVTSRQDILSGRLRHGRSMISTNTVLFFTRRVARTLVHQ